jgi:D-threonate/D-erythronate kinase
MTELVVVADDLTGAADCAVPFVPELTATVVLDVDADWPRSGVVSVDTDTRYADAAVAAERVHAAVLRAETLDAVVFKKIDSGLRGNVAAEVAAAWRGLARRATSRQPAAIVSPAFPVIGRTVVNGRLHTRGDAVGWTKPALTELFLTSGQSAVVVPLDVVRGASNLAQTITAMRGSGVEIFLLDAQTDADLDRIAGTIAELEKPTLAVGSGGMARALARRRSTRVPSTTSAGNVGTVAEKSMLFVIGSYSAMASAQRSMLVTSGAIEIKIETREDLTALATRIRNALRVGNVVLTPMPGRPLNSSHAMAVAEMLARATVMVLDSVQTVVATGGETARAILLAHGTRVLEVSRELEPGVVAMRADDGKLNLVVKAGSFGDPATLCRITSATTPKEHSR